MSFTRDWDSTRPSDTDPANLGDDEMRFIRVDVADRIADLLYGFTAGENVYSMHHKKVVFREQASITTPNADMGSVACKAVGGVCELHWKDEGGNEKQITNAGKLNVVAADIPADTINETKIQLQNNAYLAAKNFAGSGEVSLIKANASDKPVLPDGAQLATSAAPTLDADIANKKYVADQIAAKGLTTSGATVFSTTLTAANTWQDLDLSAVVGANIALVQLQVTVGSDLGYMVKTKGYGEATPKFPSGYVGPNSAHFPGIDPCSLQFTVVTDASGVVQQCGTSSVITVTVKVIGYTK